MSTREYFDLSNLKRNFEKEAQLCFTVHIVSKPLFNDFDKLT